VWKSWLFSATLCPGARSQVIEIINRLKFAVAKANGYNTALFFQRINALKKTHSSLLWQIGTQSSLA
jgi:hypothetical protein